MKRWPVLVGGAGLVGGAILAVSGYLFLGYARKAAAIAAAGSAIRVAILAPEPGSHHPVGSPVMVRAALGSEKPLAEVQLWADGELVRVSGAGSGIGPTGFFEEIPWIPVSAGDSVLVVRAIDSDGHAGESPPVPVEIRSGPNGDSAPPSSPGILRPVRAGGTGEGPSLEELSALVPPPDDSTPPSAGAGADTSTEWKPSLAGFATWLLGGTDALSSDPELFVTRQGCSVQLQLHDSMANELGFAVKRLSPAGGNTFRTIALLMPHAGTGWMTFVDEAPSAGSNVYEILAFDEVGSYWSNQAVMEVDPAECAPGGIDTPALALELVAQDSQLAAEATYCYFSLDGTQWARWPDEGFLSPAEFDQSSQFLAGLEGTRLSLDLECWGWTEGALGFLGSVHVGPESLLTGGAFPIAGPLGLEIAPAATLSQALLGGLPTLPLHVRLPGVTAAVSYDPNTCKAHLPPEAQNLFGQVLFCTPYPTYEVGEQPYLIWWVNEGQCAAGVGCLSAQQLIDLAEEEGEELLFQVYGKNPTSTPFDLSMYVVPPADPLDPFGGCPASSRYHVRVSYKGMLGPPSQKLWITSKCPEPTVVTLKVTFTELLLDDVDDDDPAWETQFVEAYGGFFAFSPTGSGAFLRLRGGGFCDPYYQGRVCMTDGSHLIGWPLCESSTLDTCTGPHAPATLEVQVRDGDPVKVGVALFDHDGASADDEVCVVEIWTDDYSTEQWAAMEEGEFWIYQGDNGNASCKLSWTITAVEVEYP